MLPSLHADEYPLRCYFLCLWFRASLIYINNCPTRCNTKQSIYFSASSLYMFWVSTTPIIRSTQNCKYSFRYWSYFCAATSLQRGQATPTIRSTQNCNYSLRYWSYFCAATSLQRGQASFMRTQNCNYSLQYWSYFCAATSLRGQAWPGVHKTVITASSTGHIFVQLPPSNMAKLACPRCREVAASVLHLVRQLLI